MAGINRENIILIDSNQDEGRDFRQGLEDTTGLSWRVLDYRSNEGRTASGSNIIRYLKYFIFPFRIFLNRRNVGSIIAWQQFYGLNFAFYCRLFGVKKINRVTVMTFIYKRKNGILGYIYDKYIKYIVTGGYIDLFTCTADKERELYSTIFKVPVERFAFVPWGGVIDHSEDAPFDEALSSQQYLFSPGRSNRDWEFLINCLKGTSFNLKIACDELVPSVMENIEIYNDIHDQLMWRYLKNCFCIIISIKDTCISAGQTVLIQAMQFRKPIIVTKSQGLTDDYITDGYNGLVIEKERDELLYAIEKLRNDQVFYKSITENAYKDYVDKYSIYQLGCNVGKAILEKKEM